MGENLETIYSQAGPSAGMSGDEGSVFEGENTAEILVILKEGTTISTESVIASIDQLTSNIEGLEVAFKQEQRLWIQKRN